MQDCEPNNGYLRVCEVIEEFRDQFGDTTQDVPTKALISYLRKALNYLARERGLQELFEYEDTFELLRVKKDGDYAAEWTLNGGKDSNLGYIIDIKWLDILNTEGKPYVVNAQYIPYKDFRRTYPLPDQTDPGTPSAFTIVTIGGKTKIIFNCPIARSFSVNMHYSAGHPRITKDTDLVRIPYLFMDAVEHMMEIYALKESADFASARADWEDMDYYVAQIREMLHANKSGFMPRTVKRSY